MEKLHDASELGMMMCGLEMMHLDLDLRNATKFIPSEPQQS